MLVWFFMECRFFFSQVPAPERWCVWMPLRVEREELDCQTQTEPSEAFKREHRDTEGVRLAQSHHLKLQLQCSSGLPQTSGRVNELQTAEGGRGQIYKLKQQLGEGGRGGKGATHEWLPVTMFQFEWRGRHYREDSIPSNSTSNLKTILGVFTVLRVLVSIFVSISTVFKDLVRCIHNILKITFMLKKKPVSQEGSDIYWIHLNLLNQLVSTMHQK